MISAAVGEEQKAEALPVLKWAGGKRQLLHEIRPRLPQKMATYFEPFVGAGAVFFALANERAFKRAVIGDANPDLVNLYVSLRDRPAAVLTHLRTHAARHSESYFYEQRERAFGSSGPSGAARLIYLNRTCFNGLYRVNREGQFNTPFGHYDKPRIADAEGLRAASRALQGVEVVHGDFAALVKRAKTGDAVYLDPPYVPTTTTANFTAFHEDGFTLSDQRRLADSMEALVKRGARALLSNSATPEALYIFGRRGWKVETVSARRNINSQATKRGAVSEILVSAPSHKRTVVT